MNGPPSRFAQVLIARETAFWGVRDDKADYRCEILLDSTKTALISGTGAKCFAGHSTLQQWHQNESLEKDLDAPHIRKKTSRDMRSNSSARRPARAISTPLSVQPSSAMRVCHSAAIVDLNNFSTFPTLAVGILAASERQMLEDSRATHLFPDSIRGLLDQQARWRAARDELKACNLHGDHGSGWSPWRRVRALATRPNAIAAAGVIRLVRTAAWAFGRSGIRDGSN